MMVAMLARMIILLLKMSGDVEENPGPGIEELLDSACSTEQLNIIAAKCNYDWRATGRRLVESRDVDDIDREGHSEQEKRDKMFEVWRKRKGSGATYRVLINAFNEVQNKQGAEMITDLLLQDPRCLPMQEPLQKIQQIGTQPAAQSAQCGCGHCAYVDIISHHCKVPRNGTNFPFIDTLKMSDNEKNILKSRLRCEAQKMFDKFDQLTEDYKSWLENNKVTLELYKRVLQNITGFEELSENSTTFLEDRKKEIRVAQDFDALHDIISGYVNWLSYSLLHTIVERLCPIINTSSDHFKERVKVYEKELNSFCQRCIYECPMPSALPPSNNVNKYLCFKVYMPERYIDIKAEKIMMFCVNLCKALNLRNHALCLQSVDKGCVEVIFSIPNSIHTTLFPLQRVMLNKLILLGVKKICTDGYVLELDTDLQHCHQMADKGKNRHDSECPGVSENEVQQPSGGTSQMFDAFAVNLMDSTKLVSDEDEELIQKLLGEASHLLCPIPPTRAWQQKVTLDERKKVIKKIVETIYPVEDPMALRDRGMASLIQCAIKEEKAMFEAAESKQQYDGKIYSIREALQEKRTKARIERHIASYRSSLDMSDYVTDLTAILNEKDHEEIYQATKSGSDQWRSIGRELGFTVDELDSITLEPGSNKVEDYYQAMLHKWLDKAPPGYPSLQSLLSALRAVGNKKQANNLEAKYHNRDS